MTDTVISVPFWFETDLLTGSLFRCALGTGQILWVRAPSAPIALQTALRELDEIIPNLTHVTVAVSRP